MRCSTVIEKRDMARDIGRNKLPNPSRREALGFLGVGGVTIPGLITAFKPGTMVGLPQAEGVPVSVQQVIPDDEIEYRPTSDTVRWSRSTDQTGPYTTESFEKWADRRAASVGSDIVLPTIQDRVDKEVTGIGKGVGPSDEIIGMTITVHVGTTYDRNEDIISEPNISTEKLVEVAPRSVRTTITLENREYTRPIPVFIEEGDIYED